MLMSSGKFGFVDLLSILYLGCFLNDPLIAQTAPSIQESVGLLGQINVLKEGQRAIQEELKEI